MTGCKITLIVIAFFGIICIILGAVIGFAVLPDVILSMVDENARLEPGTRQFELWKEPIHPLTLKIYFFEVENVQEVINNNYPKITEKGPYIYRQTRRRENVEFIEEDDTLIYYKFRWFEFDEIASSPLNQNDRITTLNVPLMNLFQMTESYWLDILSTVNTGWREAFPSMELFDEFSVNELLLDGIRFCPNVNSPVCTRLNQYADEIPTLKRDEYGLSFAFLRHRHNCANESFLIKAGMNDVEDVGTILKWRGSEILDMWQEGDICRNLRGRDSLIFPPHVTNDSVFDIFRDDICRVVSMKYASEEEYLGIPGYKYELKEDTLTNIEDQSCYCIKRTKDITGEEYCWPEGFMDLFTCLRTKLVMSHPHFLKADSSFAETVEGLTPEKENHETFIIFEPNTGTVLKAVNRVQYNMVLRNIRDPFNPTNNIQVTENLEGSVLPIFWIEEEMQLPRSLVRELRQRYFDQLVMKDVFTWVFIGFGILIFLCGLIFVFIC